MTPPVRDSLSRIARDVVACERCPRLRIWCRHVAHEKVRRFQDQRYWGRPVPGFGDPAARLLIVGLAPAAHGGNRTGRVFTGDRSGDWLFASMYRTGFASQPESVSTDDGLELRDLFITAALRCAPPDNKPTPVEMARCRPFLLEELRLFRTLRVVVTLGKIGWDTYLRARRQLGQPLPRPLPRFGHGAVAPMPDGITLCGGFHPSQQNTFTGKLTRAMLDEVIVRARELAERPPP